MKISKEKREMVILYLGISEAFSTVFILNSSVSTAKKPHTTVRQAECLRSEEMRIGMKQIEPAQSLSVKATVQKKSEEEYNKSAITDHVAQTNHSMC